MIRLLKRLSRLVLSRRTVFVSEIGCDDNDGFDALCPKRTLHNAVKSTDGWRNITIYILPTKSYEGIPVRSGFELMAERRV